MRLFTSLMIIFFIGFGPRFAQAQQANSCKQCSDQRTLAVEDIPQKPARSSTSGA